MTEHTNEEGTVRYVRCPSCGTPNPGTPGALCSRCGQPLHEETNHPAAITPPARRPAATPTVCSSCRKEIPAGSKFCGFCGAVLPTASPVVPASPKPAPHPVGTPPASAPRVAAPAVPPKAFPSPPKPATPAATTPPQPVAPAPPSPPLAARPAPVAIPAPSSAQGTQVFMGLRVPKIEAKILEVKQDGTTGSSLRIIKETSIGRGNCDASFPSDILLAPRHASVIKREGKLFLKDHGSPNGTFVKLRQDTELTPGDVFLLGRELFRLTTQRLDESMTGEGTIKMSGAPSLQPGPITAKLEHIQLTGELVEEFSLDKPETAIGRTSGDLIFKDDPYMSGMHARIVAQPGRFILQDLKSRNGVYRRIRDEIELRDADEFFLGEQLFRVEIQTIES
ncbi:MAG: FHA domain-containing protein [Terriglobia bacterium]